MPDLAVFLVTPEREVWTGAAQFVVARGVEGDIGLLPGHAPLLAALNVGAVFIDSGGERVAAAVDGGFLHVADTDEEGTTRVDILAEHALLADEIGQEDPAAYERRAEELRAEGRFGEARVETAKAITRRRLGAG